MGFSKPALISELGVRGFRTQVRLGCSREERQVPQGVRFDVLVRFRDKIKACETDQLSDTVCYAFLCEQIAQVSTSQDFQLIEHLGWKVFERLRGALPATALLDIHLVKEKPPVENLTGGSTFSLRECP